MELDKDPGAHEDGRNITLACDLCLPGQEVWDGATMIWKLAWTSCRFMSTRANLLAELGQSCQGERQHGQLLKGISKGVARRPAASVPTIMTESKSGR